MRSIEDKCKSLRASGRVNHDSILMMPPDSIAPHVNDQ